MLKIITQSDNMTLQLEVKIIDRVN